MLHKWHATVSDRRPRTNLSPEDTMTRKLRIIHLENDLFSASLTHALLADEGFECDISRVETDGVFGDLLDKGGFDLVLANLTLPAFSGMSALAMTRKRYPDLPFIIVTDTMGEEAAIESLQRGATDYVLKGRLSRLAPAVERALREAEERDKRRRAEQAQRASEQLFRNAFENAVNGMCLIELDGRFLAVNKSFCEMLGYSAEELAAMSFMELTHPEDMTPIRRLAEELLTGGKPAGNLEKRYLHKAGRIVRAVVSVFLQRDENGSPLYFVTQFQNVTEQKNLENQLRHAQKIESISRLTDGIAHDFNNMLTVIMGHGSLLANDLPDGGVLGHHLQQILSAAKRADQLTQSLLAFSRKEPIELRALDLNEVITGMEQLITAVVTEEVELRINLFGGVLTIMGDAGQLEQVLMNLITNSRDAMSQHGVLTISTGIAEIGREFVETEGFGEPGRYALLTVSDNGIGMDEETRQKIFEPFFTTREAGKGSGLGLSMAYGIVNQHKGFIGCHSEPGKGTTFRIYLSLANGDQPTATEVRKQ
jgi:two-component system, cell cycle sensor histidine kinase and response regulator CckA